MTKYIDWESVAQRYPGTTDVGGANEVGSAYLDYVEAQVEGLLAPAYTLPFSSNNLTVKDLCIDLAYIKIGTIKNEQREMLYKEFLERISRLVSGVEGMIDVDGTLIGRQGAAAWSTTKDYHPVFGMGSELDFTVDSEQVDDEYWSRQ